jgi:hypothetical protein
MVSGTRLGFGGVGYGGEARGSVWVTWAKREWKKYGDEDDFRFVEADIGKGGGVWISGRYDCRKATDRISSGKSLFSQFFEWNGAGAVLWKVEWYGGCGFGKANSGVDGAGAVGWGGWKKTSANVFQGNVTTGGFGRGDGGGPRDFDVG